MCAVRLSSDTQSPSCPACACCLPPPSPQGHDEPFLEQWHQKLHQNTTPEDVTICEAYLAYLHSGERHRPGGGERGLPTHLSLAETWLVSGIWCPVQVCDPVPVAQQLLTV